MAAGTDLLLCSARDAPQGEAAATALVDALNTGRLDPARFNVAVNRTTVPRATLH